MTQERIYPFDESHKPVKDLTSWEDDHTEILPNDTVK